MAERQNELLGLCLIGWLAMGLAACDDEPPMFDSSPRTPPQLTDPIPYDLLGSGTIYFRRGDPVFGDDYILEPVRQKSHGIALSGSSLSLSPDGERIAFVQPFFSDAVYTLNVDGSNEQRIFKVEGNGFDSYRSARYPAWTPDGLKLLFSVGGGPAILHYQSAVANPTDLHLISDFTLVVDGRKYTHNPRGAVSVSVNGKVAYVIESSSSATRDRVGLYIMNLVGQDVELLIRSTSIHSQCFSPDGNTIAYLGLVSNEIGLIETDGSNLRSVKIAEDSRFSSHGSGRGLCWSPDGTKLLFSMVDESEIGVAGTHLYTIDLDGSDLMQVTFLEGARDGNVSWSN